MATRTGAKQHTHKYHRRTVNYRPVWACGLPNCTHFMPPSMEELVIGRNSICWGCGDEFELDAFLLSQLKGIDLEYPKCIRCLRGDVSDTDVQKERVENALDGLMHMIREPKHE